MATGGLRQQCRGPLFHSSLNSEELCESREVLAVPADADEFCSQCVLWRDLVRHERAERGPRLDDEIGIFEPPFADGDPAVSHDGVNGDGADVHLIACVSASCRFGAERAVQRHADRVRSDDLVGARIAEALCAPAADRYDGVVELRPVLGELVHDAAAFCSRQSAAPHDIGRFQLLEASREDVAGYPWQAVLKIAESLRAHEQVAHDHHRPAFPDHLEGAGETAVLAVGAWFHAIIVSQAFIVV